MRESTQAKLQLYIRIGCHLCDDMEYALQQLLSARADPPAIDIIDIDEDAQLRQQYDTRVPVLMAGDEFVCEYFLDPVAVNSMLDELVEPTQRSDRNEP